jgi:hypothetical protein
VCLSSESSMTFRAVGVAGIIVGLLAGMAVLASPARANALVIDFKISYFPAAIPGNPIIPGNIQHGV